uniref:Uncharacterized protein n=1 Tax=Glossina austeni TaxID=7395 RepID=A0A1A9VQG4_GLOAU
MDHHSSGFVASPWAAVLGHHAMASAGADAGFAAAAAAAHVQNVAVAAQHHHSHHQIAAAAHHTHHAHPHHSHPHTAHHHHHHHPHSHHLNPTGMPMDLHVPQGFPYYSSGFVASPWAAVLGHHAMASAGADAGFAAAAAAAHVQNVAVAAQHHHSHHQIAAAAHHTHHAHPHHSHPHTAHHHHHHHPHSHHLNPTGMPMDLHVPQGFPYYSQRNHKSSDRRKIVKRESLVAFYAKSD